MGKHVQEYPTKKPSNFTQKTFNNFKRKEKKTATVMREGGRPYFTMKNIVGNCI
jgi:hypothetical protein